MFSGLDDIAWGEMNHAYGPADEVPDLVRGLVSDDPATRERALDAMYGAVHHQGDVYDCTVAAIPFLLEVVAEPTLPGRGAVLELLASIGGADDDRADSAAPPLYAAARHAIATGGGRLFLDLLADADVAVRRAAPTALLVCRDDAPRVVAALRERLPDEPDSRARSAIVAAVAVVGRRAASGQVDGVDVSSIAAWLAELVASPGDPEFRVVALAELGRCSPTALPPDVVSTAGALLESVYAAGEPPREPAGFATNTLIGALRERVEQEDAGRRTPHAAALVRELSFALDDRIDDRVGLLTRLLHAPDWEPRHDATHAATRLIVGWRGQYQELVALIGEQLLDSHPRLCEAAASALLPLDELAAPAADALTRSLDAAPREAPPRSPDAPRAWIVAAPDHTPHSGSTLRTLAALRDPRVLPVLRWVLEHPALPEDIGQVIANFGPAAAEFVPVIRQRLRELPTVDGYDGRRSGLVRALGQIGAAAAPAVPELLSLPVDRTVLTALGQIGPAAAEATPAIRRQLHHGKPDVEIAAASALWRLTDDPELVLPVLIRHLDGTDYDKAGAAEALAELGPAATAALPRLRELVRGTNPYGWVRLRAAQALWRATGDADAVLPTLFEVWSANPYTRVHIARSIAEMGSAATAAVPLLREELAQPRRNGGHTDPWSSASVKDDLALLRACEAALAAVGW